MNLRPALLAPLAALLLVGAGCGQTVAETAVENRINTKLGTNGAVDIDDGNMRYQGEDGVSIETGANVRVPDDFPKEVPQYPDSKVIQAAVTQVDKNASLIMTTPDASAKVQEWYQGKLDGWKKQGSYSVAGQESTQYSKGGESLMVMTGASSDGTAGGTTVTVIWSKQ